VLLLILNQSLESVSKISQLKHPNQRRVVGFSGNLVPRFDVLGNSHCHNLPCPSWPAAARFCSSRGQIPHASGSKARRTLKGSVCRLSLSDCDATSFLNRMDLFRPSLSVLRLL
jgi:hypothetical protein